VLLGNGNGTFQTAVNYAAGFGPNSVAVGDFNGDGRADLAVTNQSGKNVSVLLGNGNGTFQAAVNYTVGIDPTSVAIGDFNGDGMTDLAVSNFAGNVSVLLGNGNGTFQTAVNYNVGIDPTSVAIADLNGDGKADLAVANANTGNVSVLLGNGDGTFQTAVNYTTGSGPWSVAIADVNGDGKPDLVTANYNGSNVSILFGNGNGTFQPPANYPLGGGTGAISVAVGDFNGDGRADLSVANYNGTNVSILLGGIGIPVTVNSNHLGSAITVTGTGCEPGTYITPANLVFSTQASCSIRFADPFATGGASYSFSSVTINGASSLSNPLILNSAAAALTINAAYATVSAVSTTATHFSVIPTASSANTGVPLPFTVTALDSSNHTVTNYSNTVHFSSSDAFATLPPDTTLTNGVGTFAVSFLTTGTQTITAIDLLTSSITGTSNTISVSAATGLLFVPITPCRVADTRTFANFSGAFGPPYLGPSSPRGQTWSFPIPTGVCGTFSGALAYSINVTVKPRTPSLNFLTIWPTGQPQPNASTLNSRDGRIKANAAIVAAGSSGAISVYATDDTEVILDVSGYFVANTNPSGLAFYPLSPCRIMDTRTNGLFAGLPFGPPSLQPPSANPLQGTSRTVPVLSSNCGVPSTAKAYSLNFTSQSHGSPVQWLTAWPTGPAEPNESVLNAPTGTVVANAAIIPAGTSGGIDIYVHDMTDVIVDVDGYFAPPGSGGLSFYALTPCRVLDTRAAPYGSPFNGQLDVDVLGAACGGTPQTQAYLFNATVKPAVTPMRFVTLWAQGGTQPNASNLNAFDGVVSSNMAIVPTTDTVISAYASDNTFLILDLLGYFAP
jgi:hypothetical protein